MKINTKSINLLFFFILFIQTVVSPALAGTTQIVSPAGLPRSTNQTFFTPSIGDTNPANFVTPPLPLQGNALGNPPSSALPIHSTSTQSQPTTTKSKNGAEAPSAAGSVESFFECSAPLATQKIKSKSTKPLPNKVGKTLWHVLDNLGIPMFVGKDNDLDPALSRNTNTYAPTTEQTIISPSPQKIPESELEGTDIGPNNDAKISAP